MNIKCLDVTNAPWWKCWCTTKLFPVLENYYLCHLDYNKLMKGKALRKHSLHKKTAASVLLRLFISGNEWCHTMLIVLLKTVSLFLIVNNVNVCCYNNAYLFRSDEGHFCMWVNMLTLFPVGENCPVQCLEELLLWLQPHQCLVRKWKLLRNVTI